ncbi:MAG: DNA-processing protein DprA [Bacteroidota bacterium]
MDNKERIHQMALISTRGVGHLLWKRLIAQFGSAEAVFNSSVRALTQLPGTSKRLANEILRKDMLRTAEDLLAAHHREGIQVISCYDTAYPERLKHISSPPAFLYFRGHADLNAPKILSIVGTRTATAYGKRMTEQLIGELRIPNLLIVSGLAYGIDICAHKAALQHGLPTLTVLPSSLDIIYPPAHRSIAVSMIERGGIVTEHPLHTPLELHQFPARNRIVAGIADATVVIEAGHKSGALITAELANAHDREVFAVPGNVYERTSVGCNHLIKSQQAHLITCADDILYLMNWRADATKVRPTQAAPPKLPPLSQKEQEALQALQALKREVHIDELSHQAGIPPAQLASVLLQLELKNVVKFMPGNKFKLTVG